MPKTLGTQDAKLAGVHVGMSYMRLDRVQTHLWALFVKLSPS